MRIHTGTPCFACGEKLKEDDDVVVCPECGTPYHRQCWMEHQKCVNLPLHESGKSWEPEPSPDELPSLEQVVCPNCGTKNELGSLRCRNCGGSLGESPSVPSWQNSGGNASGQVPPQRETIQDRMVRMAEQMGLDDPYCGMDQEMDLGGESLKDVADFVDKNTIYYLPKFQRFREGRRVSLNFPCLFFPQYYFANRKMWPFAMILVALFTLLRLPQLAMTMQLYLEELQKSTELTMENAEMLQNMLDKLDVWGTFLYNASVICEYTELVCTILLAIFGNWIYYQFALRKVHRIREYGLSPEVRQMRLRAEGGTNVWMLVGIVAVQFLLSGVLSAVFLAILM